MEDARPKCCSHCNFISSILLLLRLLLQPKKVSGKKKKKEEKLTEFTLNAGTGGKLYYDVQVCRVPNNALIQHSVRTSMLSPIKCTFYSIRLD